MVAKVLWAFDIQIPIDPKTGECFKLDPDNYNEGFLHGPAPFEAIFAPRSQKHMDVIKAELPGAKSFLKPYE